MSLASRIRARFNYLFPPSPPLPPPIPSVTPATAGAPKLRRRTLVDPMHPDFLDNVDPLWPIPEEALKKNAVHETSISRRLHPHTAFGKLGSGWVEIPQNVTIPIKALVEGSHLIAMELMKNNTTPLYV